MFELATTKKVVENFCLENRKFLGKSETFSDEIENFSDRIPDPPDFETD